MKKMMAAILILICQASYAQRIEHFYSIGAGNSKIAGDLAGSARSSKAVFAPEVAAGILVQFDGVRLMPSISQTMIAGELDSRYVGSVGTSLNFDLEGYQDRLIAGVGSSLTGFQFPEGARLPSGEMFRNRQVGLRIYSGYRIQDGIIVGVRGNWMYTNLSERQGPKGRHIGFFFRFGNF